MISEASTRENVSAVVHVTTSPRMQENRSVLSSRSFRQTGLSCPNSHRRADSRPLTVGSFARHSPQICRRARRRSWRPPRVSAGRDALGGVVSQPAWRERPGWYLVATDRPDDSAAGASDDGSSHGATVEETPGSHAVSVSRLQAVVNVIKLVAKQSRPDAQRVSDWARCRKTLRQMFMRAGLGPLQGESQVA